MSEEITLDVLAERLAGLDRHLSQRIEALDRRVKEQFESSDEAIKKAETATETRFEGVNEFRQALTDQTKTFVPRSEFEQIREEQVNLASRLDSSAGVTKGGLDARSLAFLIIGSAIGLFGVLSRFFF